MTAIQTKRLLLDDITQHDHQQLFTLFSNAKVMEYYDMAALSEPHEGGEIVELFHQIEANKQGKRWAIRLPHQGALIGTCGFNSWDPSNFSTVIGYELLPEYWGKGYASEVVACLVEMAFSEQLPLPINRIEAFVVDGNHGSNNVLTKCGFVHEGCLRDKGYWNDQFADMNVFSLLKRDLS